MTAHISGAIRALVAWMVGTFTSGPRVFTNQPVTTTGTTLRLRHDLGAPVRWWLRECTATMCPRLNPESTVDTLVIDVVPDADGTCTVHVERGL